MAIVGALLAASSAQAQRRCRPAEVQVSPPDAQVRVGQQTPFLPTAYDAAGNPCAEAVFSWSSNNRNVATVDNNGVATGVAPGVAILTARTGTGAVARSGQATIQVVAIPPTVNCEATNFGLQNPDGACWDERPVPLAASVIPFPSACTGSVTPATVLMRVTAEGSVVGTPTVVRPSSCGAFSAVAAAYMADMWFSPAKKLGTPVSAWTMVVVRPGRPEMNRPPSSFWANRPTGPGCAAWERQPDGAGVPETLYINPSRLSLVRGESRQIEYHTVRADSNASRVCIVFDVYSGTRIASVDSFGVVTAGTDAGMTLVLVKVLGADVPVRPRAVAVWVRADSVRFERSEITMSPNTLDTLRIVVPQQGNRRVAPGLFRFSSSNPSVVRVGLVRPVVEALQQGTARITAESPLYEPITITIRVRPR